MDLLDLPLWVWGLLGGVGGELPQWFRIRHEPLPDWAKRPFYWVVSIIMITFGAVFVLMYQSSGVELNPILAANIGASAPLALSSLSTTVPSPTSVD